MRCLLTLLFIGLWIGLDAQTTTYPYNPDANGDSAIGAVDLLELLPIFGSYFSPSEIEINGASLEDYLIQLQASIDSLNGLEAVPTSAIDSIYIEDEELIILLSDGTDESFPLPQPIEEIQYNVTNNYSSLDVPTWMLNVKSSPSPEIFHGACMSGAISDDDDLHLFYTVVPEAIFKSQFPINCSTGNNLYNLASATVDMFNSNDPCQSYSILTLTNLDLRGASFTERNYHYGVDLYQCDASFTSWHIPAYNPPTNLIYYSSGFPLRAIATNFSYSFWQGDAAGGYQPLAENDSWEDCNLSHSNFRTMELGGNFIDCDFSYCTFYDVILHQNFGYWNCDLLNTTFRCMEEMSYFNNLPFDYWEISDDNECDEPNRYRFDYVGP